ncbi:DUF485 domain-containing protein [Streptomyces sp. NPDC058739]|uniref:DUF485 domain-containing protein n=1 Tax=Streptomyces sp. NPDC058739 TaxID=3346618 RepID=UPI0036A09FDE
MATANAPAGDNRYVAMHESAPFRALRRRSNAFTLWAIVAYMGWWILTTLLAAFAPGFFRQHIGGPVNVGLLFVMLTFVLMGATAALYLRFARTRLDPLSERLRADLEGEVR